MYTSLTVFSVNNTHYIGTFPISQVFYSIFSYNFFKRGKGEEEMETSIAKIVGENLKLARRAKGITQTQLAKELGKYQSDYSEYETGRVQLDYEKIVFLCKRLDVTPNELFGMD